MDDIDLGVIALCDRLVVGNVTWIRIRINMDRFIVFFRFIPAATVRY